MYIKNTFILIPFLSWFVLVAVQLNAQSDKSISINFDETNINFNFYSIEDYKLGVGGKNSQYQTTGSIKAKKDWILSFAVIEPFLHENGTASISPDNIGVTISTNDYSRLINYAENSPAVFSTTPVVILQSHTRGERGNSSPNYFFTVYFEMGTCAKGMNQKSILEQNLPKGKYRTKIEFIIRESL